jgi:hypothetical protein
MLAHILGEGEVSEFSYANVITAGYMIAAVFFIMTLRFGHHRFLPFSFTHSALFSLSLIFILDISGFYFVLFLHL